MDGRELGGALRGLRREKGWSQSALARRAGLSQQHLSLIERDASRAEVRTVDRVLRAMGRSLSVTTALAARMGAWRRFDAAQAAFPLWTTPAKDLASVGELAAVYSSRHREEDSLEERRRFSAAFRLRLSRVRTPG